MRRFHTRAIVDGLKGIDRAQKKADHCRGDAMRKVFARFADGGDAWPRALRCVATLDALASLASVSSGAGFCRPEVVDPARTPEGQDEEVVLALCGGRHPSLVLPPGQDAIPNDTTLGGSPSAAGNGACARMLLLTGPNMGGKSTLLRQTCLVAIVAQVLWRQKHTNETPAAMCVLHLNAATHPLRLFFSMLASLSGDNSSITPFFVAPLGCFLSPVFCAVCANGRGCLSLPLRRTVSLPQMGCFVPCASARLSPIDRVFTRLGASDRILAGQSTFFVELSEAATVLEKDAVTRLRTKSSELARAGLRPENDCGTVTSPVFYARTSFLSTNHPRCSATPRAGRWSFWTSWAAARRPSTGPRLRTRWWTTWPTRPSAARCSRPTTTASSKSGASRASNTRLDPARGLYRLVFKT